MERPGRFHPKVFCRSPELLLCKRNRKRERKFSRIGWLERIASMSTKRRKYNTTQHWLTKKQQYEAFGKGDSFLNHIKALNRDEKAQNIVAELSNLH
jgi:hypothetical protein